MGSGPSKEEFESANSRASNAEEQVRKAKNLEIEKKKNEEAKMKEVLSDPWRKNAKNGWNAEELLQMKQDVMAYKCPESTNIKFFNILLVGQISAGKSSIINTMESAFNEEEEVTNKAVAGTVGESLTKQLRSYKIKAIKFKFWDTMGLEVENNGLDMEKICMIMDGKVKPDSKLEGALDVRYPRDASEMKHKMHCLIFAVHAEKFNLLDEKVLEKLTKIRMAANERGIPCLVVCTAIDLVCDHVEKDTSKVFCSRNMQDMVAKVSERSGFPLNMIHPQRNYVKQTVKDVHIDFLTMLLFKQIIRVSKDYCERLMDSDDEDD